MTYFTLQVKILSINTFLTNHNDPLGIIHEFLPHNDVKGQLTFFHWHSFNRTTVFFRVLAFAILFENGSSNVFRATVCTRFWKLSNQNHNARFFCLCVSIPWQVGSSVKTKLVSNRNTLNYTSLELSDLSSAFQSNTKTNVSRFKKNGERLFEKRTRERNGHT